VKNLKRLDMSYFLTKKINQDPVDFSFAKSGNIVEEILTPLLFSSNQFLKHYLSITLLEGTQ
jgi:hypothetical protein